MWEAQHSHPQDQPSSAWMKARLPRNLLRYIYMDIWRDLFSCSELIQREKHAGLFLVQEDPKVETEDFQKTPVLYYLNKIFALILLFWDSMGTLLFDNKLTCEITDFWPVWFGSESELQLFTQVAVTHVRCVSNAYTDNWRDYFQ